MGDDTLSHDFFKMLQTEHRELAGALSQIQKALSQPDRERAQVTGLITEMAELVESHFHHEEEGGYFSEALEQAPRLTLKAQALLEQHPALLEDVSKLGILAEAGVESEAWWTKIETDFAAFAKRFVEHEASENRLVLEAFTDDIGTAD